MNKDDLLKQLLKTFQVEAVEHLNVMNQSLLKIERNPSKKQYKTLIQNAFRAAHSLKGAGGGYDLPVISGLAARIEQAAKDNNLDGVMTNLHKLDTYLAQVEVVFE